MTDTDFASTIANLLPTNDEWCPFNTLLAWDMTIARNVGKPLQSSEVIQHIKAEDWTHYRDDPEILPQIHTLEAMRKHPSTAVNINQSPTKWQDQWCSNRNCLKRKDHTIKDCLAFGRGKCRQYPEWWIRRKDIHLPPDQRSSQNQNSNSSTARSPATGANRTNGRPHANNAEVDSEGEDVSGDSTANVNTVLTQDDAYYAFNVCINNPAVCITCNTLALHNSTEKLFEVYHDSGANRHIFFDRSHFDNYRSITPLIIKGFGSDLSTDALGMGDVHLRATCHSRTATIKLTDVLHVPSARLNLVSQGCLDRCSMAMRSGGGTMVLSSNGTDLIMGKIQRNNLYHLLITPVSWSLLDRIEPQAPKPKSLSKRLSHRAPAAFRAGDPVPLPHRQRKLPDRYTRNNLECSNNGGLTVRGQKGGLTRLENDPDPEDTVHVLENNSFVIKVTDEQTLETYINTLLLPINDINATNPKTVAKAQQSGYWDHWLGAIHEEMELLELRSQSSLRGSQRPTSWSKSRGREMGTVHKAKQRRTDSPVQGTTGRKEIQTDPWSGFQLHLCACGPMGLNPPHTRYRRNGRSRATTHRHQDHIL